MTQLLGEEGEPFTPVRGHTHNPATQRRTIYKERWFAFVFFQGGLTTPPGLKTPLKPYILLEIRE